MSGTGASAVITYEPGGTPLGNEIRRLVKRQRPDVISPEVELLLFASCRFHLIRNVISPSLKEGKTVICDRFSDSTTAYQGFGRKINLDFIDKLHKFVTRNITPDLTFLIDLDPEKTLERKNISKVEIDRLERENLQFHKRVREGYLKIAQSESHRFITIDGSQSISAIQKQIFNHTKTRFNL